MIRRLLICCLFCCATLFCYAQDKKVIGLVIYNNERQGSAIIKRPGTSTQVISNDLGEFSITAKNGDTLITTKEGYENDTSAVTGAAYFVIRLKKKTLLLKEVIINSTALTPEKKLAENKTTYKEIYRKGDKKNMIVITPLGIGVVIDKVWSAVSKEGHDARRLQRTFVADYKNSIIDRRFSTALVSRVTGYSGERLFNFMSKYRPAYQMAKNATDYEMIQYIKKCITMDKTRSTSKNTASS